ncbi:hypothetical protein NB037_18670 [Rathayibacter sp. ZW T2_19]|uniref:Lipoprotein n=1 Tax=Rathayibacter rubneri TaxID=2950106 RepID=A0A9X2IUT2_9MICO|nr:hypothetical protein [Rathayibacter rubneri]MCM6764442.1 hypothetical protein [Rathayibacter rubneri]
MRRRGAGAAIAAVIAAAVLAGCAPAEACPGWSTTLTISVEGPGSGSVADVRLCSGDVCSRPDAVTPDGAPSYPVARDDDGRWVFEVGTAPPDDATVTIADRAGEVLIEREQPLSWRLLGEPEGPECGWRAQSRTLVIAVPEPRGSVFGTR